jgi:hypothetical protein
MRRLLAGLLVVPFVVATLSITALPASAQIPAEILKDVKAATVFVKVRTDQGAGSGSGFLIQVDGDKARIVTNQHVIAKKGQSSSAPAVEVVFDSGRKTERVFSATVAAVDVFRDLAILEVDNAKDLPKPLNLAEKVDVFETMTLYIVGFPFGAMLSTNKGNPTPTIGKGIVSSIRENEQGDVRYVQIDGDVNPGNSGGPVVDSKGRLVGVAVAKLVGTNIGLAIPPSELAAMITGRVDQIVVRTVKVEESSAEVEIELVLIDPLHQIRKASARVIPAEKLDGNPPQDKNGKFLPVPDAQVVELKIKDQKCVGSFTAKADGQKERQYRVQPAYVRGDNVLVHSVASSPHSVKFASPPVVNATPSPSPMVPPDTKPKQPNVGPNATASIPIPGVKIEPPSTRPRQIPLGPKPQPIGEIKIVDLQRGAGSPCLCWSHDGKAVYYLGGPIVRRISIPDGEETAICRVDKNCNWLCVSAKGLVLTTDFPKEMWLLDPQSLAVLSKFPIGDAKRVISAPNCKFAYFNDSSYRPAMLNVIDLQLGKVVKKYPFNEFGNGRLGFEDPVMTPDGNYLFTSSGSEELNRFRTAGIRVTFEETSPRLLQGVKAGICISSDGKYVCAPSGGGNYSQPGQMGGYSTFIYSTKSFKTIELAIAHGAYPQALGMDLKSGLIYAQNHKMQLMIFDTLGAKIKDVPLKLSLRDDSEVNQFLVHPDGRKLIVAATARLWYVEFPATRKWTDASGTFSIEADLIEVKEGKACLRRTDGTKLSIPVEKLSEGDQQYLATYANKEFARP